MKSSEFKLRIEQGLYGLINDYFGGSSLTDKFINSTLKILLKQNSYKIHGMIDLFADENGCIDEDIIIEEYSKVLGENGVIFDLRDYIKNETVRAFLPNKALVVKATDIKKMFGH